jgi:hypothetical protein
MLAARRSHRDQPVQRRRLVPPQAKAPCHRQALLHPVFGLGQAPTIGGLVTEHHQRSRLVIRRTAGAGA